MSFVNIFKSQCITVQKIVFSQLPSGCGEQNMLNFVPNIVVLDYLTTLNKLTPDIELKTKQYLESGYQREMTYKRDDGSYSAFGKSDTSGSTWLTAFVAKSFHQASKYIPVDEEITKQSLSFLADVQVSDGSFPEVGNVIHKAMQGGSSMGIALTAYTLVTFLENQSSNLKYQSTIDKALDFIVKNSLSIDDVYTLTIATYALQLAAHKSRDSFMTKLESKATIRDGLIYWESAVQKQPANPSEYESSSINVEMTAYALLSYIQAGRDTDAIPIMKWLISQRNTNGGFQSTQDTVVGLQALSRIAANIYVSEHNINIDLSYDGTKKTTISLNNANSLVLQKFDLPPSVRDIALNAQGQGFSILQISYKYNLKQIATSLSKFTLDAKVALDLTKRNLDLEICTSFIPDRVANKSSMAVMEVEFPSGFIFNSDGLVKLKSTNKVKVNIIFSTHIIFVILFVSSYRELKLKMATHF